jgi:hypothetical protein
MLTIFHYKNCSSETENFQFHQASKLESLASKKKKKKKKERKKHFHPLLLFFLSRFFFFLSLFSSSAGPQIDLQSTEKQQKIQKMMNFSERCGWAGHILICIIESKPKIECIGLITSLITFRKPKSCLSRHHSIHLSRSWNLQEVQHGKEPQENVFGGELGNGLGGGRLGGSELGSSRLICWTKNEKEWV